METECHVPASWRRLSAGLRVKRPRQPASVSLQQPEAAGVAGVKVQAAGVAGVEVQEPSVEPSRSCQDGVQEVASTSSTCTSFGASHDRHPQHFVSELWDSCVELLQQATSRPAEHEEARGADAPIPLWDKDASAKLTGRARFSESESGAQDGRHEGLDSGATAEGGLLSKMRGQGRGACPQCPPPSPGGSPRNIMYSLGGGQFPLLRVQVVGKTVRAAVMVRSSDGKVAGCAISSDGVCQTVSKVTAEVYRELSKDPHTVAILIGATGGGVAVGASGAAAGAATGGTLGALVGLVFAPLSLGLSIPVGAAVGSCTGLCAGAATGGAAGGLGGGLVGHVVGRWLALGGAAM